jgi:hypothetical protein
MDASVKIKVKGKLTPKQAYMALRGGKLRLPDF